MHKCFMDIGFEAELNTKEDPELLELAQKMCNETPDTRALAITELREMIFVSQFSSFNRYQIGQYLLTNASQIDRQERGECQPIRTDDEYLLRFLRVRNFVVPRAHRLLVRYCTFREQNKHLYEGVDLWGLIKVKDAYEGTIFDRPDVGRLSIFRFGMWDPNEFPVDDLVRAGMAMAEIGVRQPKLQIFGGTVLVDLEGLTMRHVAALTPSIAYQIVCLMGVAVPGRLRGVHIINYSWLFNTFFYLFKRIIPRNGWKKIHFHGNDLNSLHQHIDLECLPLRYGGTCKNTTSVGLWLKKVKQYRDEQFDKDMKQLGYLIKE